MMAYARPVLCRLCGFPAPDGGVPVSQVDKEKLSKWCLRMMDTELDEEGLGAAVFCHFCVADARFEHQNLVDIGVMCPFEWWKSATKIDPCNFYMGDGIIQPCAVQIEKLSTEEIKVAASSDPNLHQAKLKGCKCLFCPEEFPSNYTMKHHVLQTHRNKTFFRCKSCSEIFKSKLENSTHFRMAHKDKSSCIYCGTRFVGLRQYDNHMQKYHKEEAIQCNYNKGCRIFFRTRAELEVHVKEKHENAAKRTKCDYCNKYFLTRDIYKHKVVHHSSEIIQCDFHKRCFLFFKTEEDRVKHVEEAHLSKKDLAQCIYCKKHVPRYMLGNLHVNKFHQKIAIRCNFSKMCLTFFHTHEERQKHVRDVHELKFLTKARCIYCEKVYSDYKKLRMHVNHVHSKMMIYCKWRGCHSYFHSDPELEEHFQHTHAANDRKNSLRCEMCCYKTSTKVNLKNHILQNHNSDYFQCPFCPQTFKAQTFLTAHKHQMHTKPKSRCGACLKEFRNLKPHLRKNKCLNCGLVANCLTEIVQHQKICAIKLKLRKEKRNICNFCKAAFNTKGACDYHIFKEHVKIKTNKNRRYCSLCFKCLISSEELEKHRKSEGHLKNIQNAPFTCDFCHKQYLSMKNIYKHVRLTHLQQIAHFPCAECGKNFRRKSCLAKHTKYSHSREPKVFKCDLCNAALRCMYSLNIHKIAVHKLF